VSYWGLTHIYANYTTCYWWGCTTSYGQEIPCSDSSSATCEYTTPTWLGPGWSNYTYSTIAFNRATMDSLTDFMKIKVATHELGHAQGLAHPNCTSIMVTGILSFNTPQPHDVYDFDQLYPSSYWWMPYAC
jgi:predicted Zn-dependent protease